MTTHSRLSPSSRIRWSKCPASVRESLKYPQPPSGPAAIDGTHTHTLLEHCIKAIQNTPDSDITPAASSMIGVKLKDHEGEFVIDRERAERVDIALKYINTRIAEHLFTVGGQALVNSETRVDPHYYVGRHDLAGTTDVVLGLGELLEVIDYKDGMAPVDAKDNAQMEIYALGVLAAFRKPDADQIPYKRIRMTIIQPKVAAKGLPAISSHEIATEELLAKVPQIIAEAAATDDPNAPFVPGESQCKYCPVKRCAARTAHALENVGISFQNLDVAKEAANKEPTEMSDEQIKEIVESAPLLRGMLDAVEAEALRRFESGKVIDGLKAVRGRGSRSWAFDEDAIAEKLKKMGVPKDVIWTTKVISPAQIEKAQWEATKGGEKITKTLSERQLKVIEGEYVKKSEGKLTVVPLSDNRPAVTLNAAPMFAPVVDVLPSWMS